VSGSLCAATQAPRRSRWRCGRRRYNLALILYAAATLLWIWILSRVNLSLAYPWVAVGMVIVPLLGWLVFGERVGSIFWLGVAFIVIGVGLTQYAASPAA